jgi:hypothetical protein
MFSVTMWIHIFHGDQGLERIIRHIASYAGREWRGLDLRSSPPSSTTCPIDAILVEPQLSRCYANCRRWVAINPAAAALSLTPPTPSRRLNKAAIPLPPYLNELDLRGDALDPAIHNMFLQADLPHCTYFGDTKWERSLRLYSRQPYQA